MGQGVPGCLGDGSLVGRGILDWTGLRAAKNEMQSQGRPGQVAVARERKAVSEEEEEET